jgi:hypothetical protein
MKNSINTNLNHKNAPSEWAQIMADIVDKLVGMNKSTTIRFDDFEIDVPRLKGPDGTDLGSATCVVNGKILYTTTEFNKE